MSAGSYWKLCRKGGSEKYSGFSGRLMVEFQEGQSVELLICDRTDIGYRAIINNSREGYKIWISGTSVVGDKLTNS